MTMDTLPEASVIIDSIKMVIERNTVESAEQKTPPQVPKNTPYLQL